MDYLKSHNLASAPAMFVVSRYLATRPRGENERELRRVLQPRAMKPDKDSASRESGGNDVLAASLEVGSDLGIFEAEGVRSDQRIWFLSREIQDYMGGLPSADYHAFRSLLLRRIGSRAVEAVESGERPSDVAVALTWLLLRDPLAPLSTSWDMSGAEGAVLAAKLDTAVANAEQWRALVRWARSLGLATDTPVKGESRLVVDPTRAVEDVLGQLPSQAPADQWFKHLYSLLPVLGDRKLVSAIPAGSATISEVHASTALAVQRLERVGRLRLLPSDDSRNAVVLRLGRQERRVGAVHIEREAA